MFVGPDAALGGAPAAPAVGGCCSAAAWARGCRPSGWARVIFGTIWLLALIGLARRPDRRAVMAAWITALVGLGMAVALSRLVVSIPPVGHRGPAVGGVPTC